MPQRNKEIDIAGEWRTSHEPSSEGDFFKEAQEIVNLFHRYKKDLNHTHFEGTEYVATDKISFVYIPESAPELPPGSVDAGSKESSLVPANLEDREIEIPESNAEVAKAEENPTPNAEVRFLWPTNRYDRKTLSDSPEILCLLNLNLSDPDDFTSVHRLRMTETGIVTDDALQDIDFRQIDALRQAINSTNNAMRNKQEARLQRRSDHMWVIGGAAVVFAAGSTIIGLVYRHYDIKHEKAHRRAEERRIFDATNWHMDGTPAPVNNEGLHQLAPNVFVKIPEYKNGDDLLNARRIRFEDGCFVFDVNIKKDENVVLATEKNSPGASKPLNVLEDNGLLEVCGPGVVDDRGYIKSREIAVQIQR